MTKNTWNQLQTVIDNGDPVKDVCDEDELIAYILDLRSRLELEPNEV